MRRKKRRKASSCVEECRRLYWNLRSWTFEEFCYLVNRLDRLEDKLTAEIAGLREKLR